MIERLVWQPQNLGVNLGVMDDAKIVVVLQSMWFHTFHLPKTQVQSQTVHQ